MGLSAKYIGLACKMGYNNMNSEIGLVIMLQCLRKPALMVLSWQKKMHRHIKFPSGFPSLSARFGVY